MPTASDLWRMSRRELKDVLCDGYPIEPDGLDDTEYEGVSLGLPEVVERLTWKKFMKVFHRDPTHGCLRGWNVRIEQNPMSGPWEPQRRRGQPVTFGHYRVVSAAGHRMPWRCDQALLIHYGLGGNPRLDPTARMRDPLVAVHPGDNELLLGWSYLDLGRRQVPTPSFFSLQRGGALSHRIPPPRPPSGVEGCAVQPRPR